MDVLGVLEMLCALCVCMYEQMYVCVCVCVCLKGRLKQEKGNQAREKQRSKIFLRLMPQIFLLHRSVKFGGCVGGMFDNGKEKKESFCLCIC